MKQILYLIFGLLLFGCSGNGDAPPPEFNSKFLEQLVINSINGSKTANDSLSGLFDLTIPFSTELNLLQIDSVKISGGKIIYTVLFEHPNPVYNRFAVYDSLLNCYLIDKSLNGNLSAKSIRTRSNQFLQVIENFISKDTLMLERLSFYLMEDSSASLSFRTFTKIVMPRIEYTQTLVEHSDERIVTSISSSRPSSLNNKGDVFTYNYRLKTYASEADLFSKFVIDEVKRFDAQINKPEITDRESALLSVGISPWEDTLSLVQSSINGGGYSISLDANWKELKDVSISNYLKKELRGTRYLNNNLGASIFVISLEDQDSSEMYVSSALDKSSEGNYKVRFSDKQETGKLYVQFFEYSCSGRKFLLILEASKYTYERYKQLYEEIINSFVLDC